MKENRELKNKLTEPQSAGSDNKIKPYVEEKRDSLTSGAGETVSRHRKVSS